MLSNSVCNQNQDISFRDIFYGAGCGCINQVGDLCPIVMHLYLYLYESIK